MSNGLIEAAVGLAVLGFAAKTFDDVTRPKSNKRRKQDQFGGNIFGSTRRSRRKRNEVFDFDF